MLKSNPINNIIPDEKSSVAVIGSGFSRLSAEAYLVKA